MIEKMKETPSAKMKKVQDKIETMEEEIAKIRTEKEDLEMKGQEKDQIMEQMKEDLQQAQAESYKLEPVEEEKYKWKVRAEYDHEKREEMVKSYEKMMDIVQTHATNLATRVREANEEIDSNPGMKLPWKIFKLVKYCIQWPPYGLPPNYTPPIAVESSDNNPRAATINQLNPGPPLESNQAAREVSQTQPTDPLLMPYHFPPNYIPPQNNNPETNQAFGPQSTTSQQTIFINFQGESQRPHAILASKEIHQFQNPATEDSQSKEKLQILEERLRVIEGGNHYVFGVNAIGESSGHYLIKKISNVKTPMKVIFEELCEFGGIKGLAETERSNDKEMKCGFHCSDEHSIEECDEFKQILQSVETAVSTLSTDEQTISMPKPLDIHFIKVPWKYDVQAFASDAITNISGIGGITRSGRIYTPKKLREEQSKEATFEIANPSYVREGAQIVRPSMSNASIMVARVMLKKGYQPGQGLGKFLNGVTKMPSSKEKKDRCGLGYQPTKADKKMFAEDKKEKRMARLENREPKTERIPICHILQSFRSASLLFSDQVGTVGDRNDTDADQDAKWVIPCFPETELTNWEIIEFPMTFKIESK
ncbi:G-patch domain [Sesbania bispinosa]|nr:G-patch domain [Sesbania bispinosa]